MRTLDELLQDERYQAALAAAREKRDSPPAEPEPYTPPAKALHRYTADELQEAADHCRYCGGMGYVRQAIESVEDPDFGRLWPCPACRRFRQEQRRRRVLERMQPRIDAYTLLKGDLLTCTFSTFDYRIPENKTAWTTVRTWAGDVYNARAGRRPWLYLHGPTGNGKTHLAAAAANGLSGVHVGTVFTTLPELLGMVSRDNFHDFEPTIRVLQQVPVLIVDDVRAEDLTLDWKLTVLFRILDARYVTRAATMGVSNLPVVSQQGEPAIQDFEPRIANRFQDRRLCRIFTHTGPDYRSQAPPPD